MIEYAALAFVVIVATALAVSWFERRAPLLGRRAVLNLTDGTAMRGVLVRQRGAWLILHDVELLRVDNAAGGPVRVDGAVYVERPRILFAQVLP